MHQLLLDINGLIGQMRSDSITRFLAEGVGFAYLVIAIVVLSSGIFGVDAVATFLTGVALPRAELSGLLLGMWIILRFSTWPLIRAIWPLSGQTGG